MYLSTKIAALKNQIGSNYSSFAQTLDSTSKGVLIASNDYAMSILRTIRKMGKELAIYKKTIMIPLAPGQRYYSVYIDSYTKDKVDYLKTTQIAFLGRNQENVPVVGEIDAVTYESIERNQYVDTFKVGQKLYGSEIAFKSSGLYDWPVTGHLDTITAVNDNQITVGTSATLGYTVTNLEFAEKLQNHMATVTVAGTTATLDADVKANGWAAGDIVYVSDGVPAFMLLTVRVIPKMTYFDTLTTSTLAVSIPILPQFEDEIDDICLAYLYKLMVARNPEFVKTYSALLQTGLIKDPDKVITKMKADARTADSAVIKPYNYSEQRYGRG